MARKYELKRRAERREATRQRIVEATIELHSTLGPARTTVSEIARRAGVQRHTFYDHFSTERDLALACSGHAVERDPPPDPALWREIGDPEARLRHALGEVYAHFERNEGMLGCVLRDAEVDELTREMVELRLDRRAAMRDALAAPFRRRGRRRERLLAMVELALDFRTWRRLVGSGLSRGEAIEAMVAAVRCQ